MDSVMRPLVQEEVAVPPDNSEVVRRMFRQKVVEELEKARLADLAAMERINEEFEALLEGEMQGGSLHLKPMTAKIGSLEECINLTVKMAKDKLTGSNEAGARLQVLTIPVWQVAMNVQSVQNRQIQLVVDSLNAHTNEMAANLQGGIEQARGQFTDIPSVELLGRLQQESAAWMTSKSIQTIAMPLELIGVVSTLRAVFDRQLGRIAARAAATAAADAGLAVADGPLPFGEAAAAVISVGCLVWSVHDLNQACKNLEKELPIKLAGAMLEARDEAKTKFHHQQQALLEEAAAHRKQLADQTMELITIAQAQ